ncbi:uncharacterized protein LOC129593171 [Paramacrobiotus metropolitanus]|uniref:uncharacterized protein LOC129593171 n=1 Tax=Paramacrobiotus metropolitanus TaxID=2943436 RepID=UPI002445A344|nr:uncharacterized protein LOC129593171 [Paramacrobiotus metropolitanus]
MWSHLFSSLQRILTLHSWLLCALCLWQRDIRCSACSTRKTAVTDSDQSAVTIDLTKWEPLEEVIEGSAKEDDLVTFEFRSAATTTAPPSAAAGGMVRPRLGQNASFDCPVPVGGRLSDIHWTVQGRTVFQRGQPVAHHPDYEFAQRNGSVAVLRILNVSMASSGEVVCHLQEVVLRRYTLIPRVTRASEVFETDLAQQHRAVVGGSFKLSCRVRVPLAPEVAADVREHYMMRSRGVLYLIPRVYNRRRRKTRVSGGVIEQESL